MRPNGRGEDGAAGDPMLGWSSVQLSPKAEAKGTCEAKLTVVLRPSSPHNSIDEVNSEVIFISVGEPAKRGRADTELAGFITHVLELNEEQVKLEENVSKKSKTLVLSGLSHDKRSLIWQLQSKVGQKHAARFAAEKANAALRDEDQSSKRRKDEQSEYRRLQEEADADAVSAAAALPSPYAEKVASRPALPRGLRVRRPGEEALQPEPSEACSMPEEKDEVEQKVDDSGGPEGASSALQKLAHYSSDESEEDSEES